MTSLEPIYSNGDRDGLAQIIAPAKRRAGTLSCVSKKALPPDQDEAVRALAAKLVRDHFGGNESAAAKRLGMSQPMLHEIIQGTRGAGVSTLIALADYANMSVDAVLGRSATGEAPLRQHPDWPAARAEAEDRHPEIDPSVLDLMGQGWVPGGAPIRIDGAYVAGLAREYLGVQARSEVRSRRRSG